eukprot:SAG25_NODE_7_length_29214_cov_40.245818_34_plen_67_part_00
MVYHSFCDRPRSQDSYCEGPYIYRDWDSNPSWRMGWNKTNGSAIEIISICRPNKTIKSKCFSYVSK